VSSPLEPTLIKPAPLKILVVDDDVAVGTLVAQLLRASGYEVEHALDPVKALPLIRDTQYSLTILDHEPPHLDGLALLERIRLENNVPVVMLTATDRSADAVQAIRLGAYDYLVKPVDGKRLIETVRQAIGSIVGIGQRIACYQIDREVGRGGMGVVYAARDPRLDRTVALKVLLPEFAADPGYELRFLEEARVAAKFSHPNIVTVYEAGRAGGRLFMAMEFVNGQLLERFIHANTPLPITRVLEIGGQVAAALEAMHAAGMVHRDLKPANLMVTTASTVKILDFGLVRPLDVHPEVAKDDVSGTLSYTPPEVLTKGLADARGDIYALGVVLCELLTGTRAFESRSMFDLINRIVEGRVAKPLSEVEGVPPEGLALLRRMTAVKPEDRIPTMGAVRAEIKALWGIVGDRRVPASPQ
jgi:serine/threonine protein kinase